MWAGIDFNWSRSLIVFEFVDFFSLILQAELAALPCNLFICDIQLTSVWKQSGLALLQKIYL